MMTTLIKTNPPPSAWFAAHANIRTDGYVILAALLRQPAAENLIPILQSLKWNEALPEKTGLALEALRRAAHNCAHDTLGKEYHHLFVGLGAGELVPYASWYRNGTLASAALAFLRADLIRLGIVSQTDSHETEDQAGTICEIMALLSRMENGFCGNAQLDFFQQHVISWMITFFEDLQSAKAADFYRVVGSFGKCFLECEHEYLKYWTVGNKREVQN